MTRANVGSSVQSSTPGGAALLCGLCSAYNLKILCIAHDFVLIATTAVRLELSLYDV